MKPSLAKLYALIESLEISQKNPNRVIVIKFYTVQHDFSDRFGDEILKIEAKLSNGKVYKLTPYSEIPFTFMGGLEPFNVDAISEETLEEICDAIEQGLLEIAAENYIAGVKNGSIFDTELQDSLGIDSIIAFVKDGFNPMEIKWQEYQMNPNPRIDDLSLIYCYNSNSIPVPKERDVPSIVNATLDEITRRGARKVGISQITFKGLFGDEFDGNIAFKLLWDSVNRWIAKDGNSAKIDEIILILDPECYVKNDSRLINYVGHVGSTFIEGKHLDAVFAPKERDGSRMLRSGSIKGGVEVEYYYYERGTDEELTVAEYKEKIIDFLDAMEWTGSKRIATYGLYLKDENGKELSKKEDDDTILGILQEWVDNNKDSGVTIYYVNHYFPKK